MSVTVTKLTLEENNLETCHPGETTSKDMATLPAVIKLCERLKTERIDYCHWKSNAAIDRSASGDNDLDLLVSRADAQRFTVLLDQLGYKESHVLPDEQLPGIRDFYGYDETTARLIHVHAHFQLVLGHDLTKNYHLPIERHTWILRFRENCLEYLLRNLNSSVFVIRMVLKHSTLDAILMRHGSLSASERRELEFLLSQTTLEKSGAVLEQLSALCRLPPVRSLRSGLATRMSTLETDSGRPTTPG